MAAAQSPNPLSPSTDDWGDFVSADRAPAHPPLNNLNNQVPVPLPPPEHEPPHAPLPLLHEPTSTTSTAPTAPLQGFDTLDDVQRYALGAVAVVLLNEHAADLNGVAFARSHAATILLALGLREGQQTALLALDPDADGRAAVISQCVSLVGDDASRFAAIQAMLALAVARGAYDARSRAFLAAVASAFGISWRAVAAVELAVAIQLVDAAAAAASDLDTDTDAASRDDDASLAKPPAGAARSEKGSSSSSAAPRTVDELLIERRKKKMRYRKAVKIGGITLVGGMLFGLTGGLIAPALLSALAGVGVASAAGLAASGTVASGAVVGGLFGVAGAGFTVKKARNRVSTNLEEFDFERPDDPRVIEERKRKAERERKKMEKLIAARLKEEAEANAQLAIEGAPSSANGNCFDSEKELPRPTVVSDDDADDEESDSSKKGKWGASKKKKKKREKLKVGARGLEEASHIPGLHVCICVPAWLTEKSFGAALDQFEPALKQELPCSQHIALRWESRRLYEMGLAFAKFWASKATVTTLQQAYPHVVAAASTVAGAVAFAFAIPLTIMSCMDYVDNPWSILVSRSNGAGDELADVLVERSYGQRPVSLFGYSIGARVIFKCLQSLASRGALGIVDNVFLMGAAVTADPERWKKIRPVVAGRIVNAYGSYDMALACFHRGCGHGVYISGLRRVELDGVENLNMAYLGIEGHRELKDCVPRVMKAMGVGVGYMVMPPARLVRRRSRSRGHGPRSDSPVCEEPERLANRSRETSRNNSPSENVVEGNSSLGGTQIDSFWTTGSPGRRAAEDQLEIDDALTLPPNMSAPGLSSSLQVSGDPSQLPTIETEALESDQSKKKKSKSWLSWNSWTTTGSKSGRKSKLKKEEDEQRKRSAVNADSVTAGIGSMNLDTTSELNGGMLEESARGPPSVFNAFDEQAYRGESIAAGENGAQGKDDILAIEGEEEDVAEEFDWEKQRRIWEEQERQIQERGFADSAAEIEMRSKMILGIGIEVAGRRICRFLDQDADLPVARKEEIFTNCLEDQRGVIVRVYEHEKRTKSVAVNMLKNDEQYPKLLGELEVRLRQAAIRGKLRIAVAMWACENGDICAEAEERLEDDEIGDRAELRVPRSELCTMAERTRLEAAERKRIEAQIQKEMRARAASDVPALPAAAGDGVDTVADIDRAEVGDDVPGASHPASERDEDGFHWRSARDGNKSIRGREVSPD